MADGDWSQRGYDVVERTAWVAQNDGFGEFREPAFDGIVQADPPSIDKGHRRCRHDRLGERSDAKEMVTSHRWSAHGGHAGSGNQHVGTFGNERDCAGYPTRPDQGIDGFLQAFHDSLRMCWRVASTLR